MDEHLKINNLLCFISSAIHSIATDDIISSCITFYSATVIKEAKTCLFAELKEEPKWRRGEDRIRAELQDIIETLNNCNNEMINLPKFVSDSFDAMPFSGTFGKFGESIINLQEEILLLKEEVKHLKEIRLLETTSNNDLISIKEGIFDIKSSIRSLKIETMRKDVSDCNNAFASLSSNMNERIETMEELVESGAYALASAPPLSQFDLSLRSPLSPCDFDTDDEHDKINKISNEVSSNLSLKAKRNFTESVPDNKINIVSRNTGAISKTRKLSNTKTKNESNLPTEKSWTSVVKLTTMKAHNADMDGPESRAVPGKSPKPGQRMTSDGFTLVQNKRFKYNNVIGKKKTESSVNFKCAKRLAEFYVGRCDLSVTADDISTYISKELGINLDAIVKLNSKYPKVNSFKITVPLAYKDKILSDDVWPEGIVIRKFLNSPNFHNVNNA